jgi:hypothetical protein
MISVDEILFIYLLNINRDNIWRIPFENEHLFENFGSTFSDLNQTFFEFYETISKNFVVLDFFGWELLHD